MLRRIWDGGLMESIGLAELGLGAGVLAVAGLLLNPRITKQLSGWGGQLVKGAQDIWSEAKERPGLVIGATAIAAGGAALAAAPTGGATAPAAAATAAPAALAAVPVMLEGVERAVGVKKLLDDLLEPDESEKDKKEHE